MRRVYNEGLELCTGTIDGAGLVSSFSVVFSGPVCNWGYFDDTNILNYL